MDYNRIEVSSKRLSSGSTGVAIMTLAKGTLGVGILTLPYKTMLGGVPIYLLLLLATAFLTVKSVEMIAHGARKTHKFVFEEITEALLGRGVSLLLGISLLVNCYGSAVIYLIAIGDALRSLSVNVTFTLNPVELSSMLTVLVGLSFAVISLVNHVGTLWFLSLAGLVGVLITVVSLIYVLSICGISTTLSEPPALGTMDSIMRARGRWIDDVGLVSTLTFALCNQYNVAQVLGELGDISEANARRVAFASTAIPVAVYIPTAVMGYLSYGFSVENNILKNFAPMVAQGDWIIRLGIGAVILSVMTCAILNTQAMRLSVFYLLPAGSQGRRWVQFLVTLVISGTPIVIAIIYPNISSLLDLVGAGAGCIMCLIVPALISLSLESQHRTSRNRFFWFCKCLVSHPIEWFMIIGGILLGIFGTIFELYNCFKRPK